MRPLFWQGIDLVRETIERFEEQLREAVNEDHSARRRNELTWRITRLNWEKCRFVYDLYWKKKVSKGERRRWGVAGGTRAERRGEKEGRKESSVRVVCTRDDAR